MFPERMTLRTAYEILIRPAKLTSGGTRSAERTAIDWFERLVPDVPVIPVSAITSAHLAQWRAAWMSETGLRPQTWNKYLRHVRCVMRDLFDLDVIAKLPRCKQLPEEEPGVRVASQDEIRQVYAACGHALWPRHEWIPARQWWQALVVTAYSTGLRKGDILGIQKDDIDAARLVLFIRQQKTRKLRATPLNQATVDHLLRITEQDRPSVFWSTGSNKQLYREWHRIQSAAGIPEDQHFGIHDLRRTCGSVVYEQSGIHAASELLAHSSLSVTRKHYIASGIVEESLRDAVDRMPLPFGD